MANSKINQVNINGVFYDIEALLFGGKTYQELIDYLASLHILISSDAATTPVGVVWTNDKGVSITGTLDATKAAKGTVYLVKHDHLEDPKTGDIYDEYVPANGVWEKIGNTDIDLSDYCKKETATSGPNNNSTGAVSGAGEIATSSVAGYTATGSASITYKKSNTSTKSATGGVDAKTGEIAGHTHSFTGVTATIGITSSGSAESTGSHSHTVNPSTVKVVKTAIGSTTTIKVFSGTNISGGEHAHTVTVNSHEHGTAKTVVNSVSVGSSTSVVTGVTSDGTIGAVTNIAVDTASIYQITGVGTTPTKKTLTATDVAGVSGTVLYIGKAIAGSTSTTAGTIQVIDSVGTTASRSAVTIVASVSNGTKTPVLTGVKASGSTIAVTGITYGTTSVAGDVSNKTLTATCQSNTHTHDITTEDQTIVTDVATTSETVLAGVTLSSNGSHSHTVSVTGSTTFQPTGSIGSAGGHSHSYTAPAAHSHDITLTDTTITGTVEVAISSHAHTVGVAAHTHSLNNHTHVQK